MNKANVNYLHLFIFGVVAMFTVYAGEQVSRSTTPLAASWVFRSVCISAFIAILSFGLSFIPAAQNNKATEEKNYWIKVVKSLYYYDGFEVPQVSKGVAIGIQEGSQKIGELSMIQYIAYKRAMLLTYCAFIFAILTSLLFCIGVCLL